MSGLPSPGAVAWVTGGSAGIGLALANRLSRHGLTVAISARGEEDLAKAVANAPGPGKLVAYRLDVTDRAATEAVVARIEDELGRIELAVLNAGTHQPMEAASFDVDDLEKLVRINLLGTGNGLTALLPRMTARHAGHVAIVASAAGCIGLPSSAGYGATKAGLINMAESLQPDLALDGVKMQVINPGFVETPLTDRNDFEMPFLMKPDDAADAMVKGLKSDSFQVMFPRGLAWPIRLMRALPYAPVLWMTRRIALKRRKQTDG